MTGLGILDLQLPPQQWRVDIHSPDFETDAFAVAEDAERARKTRKRANKVKGKRRTKLLKLADLLDPAITPETPQTPASARYMRELRIRTLGWVWKLVVEDATGKVARFDIIKPAWAFSLKQLREQTPHRLRAEFRAELLRAAKQVIPGGAPNCTGFLFAALHGDFENPGKYFQVHWHVVATGDWVAVVNQLREIKAYRPTDRVKRPIHEKRKLDNLAYALTYLMKTYWPSKWSGYVSGVKANRRARGHARIPEPFHSGLLLWLHRWKINDMILIINLRVYKTGLVTKSVHE